MSMASRRAESASASSHPYASPNPSPFSFSFCRSSSSFASKLAPFVRSRFEPAGASTVSQRSPEVLCPYLRTSPSFPIVSPHVRLQRSPPAPTRQVSPTFLLTAPSEEKRSSHLSPHRVPAPFSAHLSVHLMVSAPGPASSVCSPHFSHHAWMPCLPDFSTDRSEAPEASNFSHHFSCHSFPVASRAHLSALRSMRSDSSSSPAAPEEEDAEETE